jgi:predicted acetyltransferase
VEQREQLALVLPTDELEQAYRECEDDFQRAGETFLGTAQGDYRRFVQRCALNHRGVAGLVPQTDYFLVRLAAGQATIVGRSALRHRLSATLRDVGGHIGYRIRPSERRRGYGTRLLAMTLIEAWKLGLDAVLLTCDRIGLSPAASRRALSPGGEALVA